MPHFTLSKTTKSTATRKHLKRIIIMRTIVLQINNCHTIDCILHVAHWTTTNQSDCAYWLLVYSWHSLHNHCHRHNSLLFFLSLSFFVWIFIWFVHCKCIDFTILLLPYSEQPQLQPHTMYSFNQTNPNQINKQKTDFIYLFVSLLRKQFFSYTKTPLPSW